MKKIILSTITASLLFTGSVYANQKAAKDATVKEVSTIAVNNAKNDVKEKQSKLVQEAIDSLKYAHDALVSLKKKDSNEATQYLEKALGKLDVILSAKNAPKFLVIDNIVRVNEFIGTKEDVKTVLKNVKKLLNEGKVQEARTLLLPLQSEIDVTVVSLPLVSYPDALKLAAKYVQSNEVQKAKDVLKIALSTFTEVTQIVPIPLLKATDLIASASNTAKEDKKRAIMYLDAASDSLDIAESLGYVSKSETTYKMLHEKIIEIKKEVEGGNKTEKHFDGLKKKLKEFKEKIFAGDKG